VVPFTREIWECPPALPAADFVRHLVDSLGMRALCVGEDFALGRGREGTIDALRAMGIEVVTVALMCEPGRREKISSSRLRARLVAAHA
jgi:riboflavin kinase/FMN adenylyltransferase